jgi:2-polyprenyl-6-methoxyphenol hydroxylase-like FAD-dependent oxidoreductase
MTDALRDAHLLSQAVAAVLRGEDEVASYAGYQARRDRIAGPIFSAVDQLAGYRWDVPAVRRLLLELSSAMSDEVEALSVLRADA